MQGLQINELLIKVQTNLQNNSHTKNYSLRASIHQNEGEWSIVLTGRVNSFYHKQVAQEITRNLVKSECNGTAHLFQVKNKINVLSFSKPKRAKNGS